MLKNNVVSSSISFLIACILSFLCSKITALSGIFPFAFMVTFAVCSALCEKEYAAIVGALSVIVAYFISNDMMVIYTAIVAVAAGIVLGQMIRKKVTVMSLTVASSVGLVILYAMYIFIFAKMNGFTSLDGIFDMLSQTMLTSVNGADENTVEIMRLGVRTIRDLFPAIVIISSVTMGYLIVFLTGIILSFSKNLIKPDMGFSRLRADLITTVVFVVAMAVTIFAGYGIVGIIAENIYIILMFVLQICGLSLLDFVLKNVKQMNLALRILILFFVFSIQIFSVILIMAAILDARRNFRKLS